MLHPRIFLLLSVAWVTVLLGHTVSLEARGLQDSGAVNPGPPVQSPPNAVPRPTSVQRSAAPVSPQREAITRYCVACHSDRLNTAGLALNIIDVDNVGGNVAAWEKVVRKLRARAMPPAVPGRLRPDDSTYEFLIAYLEMALDRSAAEEPNPGRTETFQRLNRTEYQNTIRDLLALEIDATSLLPTDDASHGFDNVNVGELSPTLLDRYLSAAQKVSRLAVGGAAGAPGARMVTLAANFTQRDQVFSYQLDRPLPLGTRGGTSFSHTFSHDAEYDFQIRLTRDRNERIEGLHESVQIELSLDDARLQLFAPSGEQGYAMGRLELDAELKGRFPVRAGPHVVSVAFLKKTSALSEDVRQSFVNDGADTGSRSAASIFSVSIAGPFDPADPGDTPSRRRIFTCRPAAPRDEVGCATRILEGLARRAYRGPVASADLQRLLAFYEEGRAGGAGFESGIEMALRALLVSPKFLFRIERDPDNVEPGTAYRLSDVELASRLSFFLWSSIPDDELLDLATRRTLSQPVVLEGQVRRMLADPRSDALVTNFVGQWLHSRNVLAATPNQRMFLDFDDNLRQASGRETELFFESILREDRSVLDLLQANYTFVNERLAKHYGIPNVYGSHFRRVTLKDGSERGGLLGQASILTVTSYADRTSPVRRGKWVLENILGMPPPPPPPDVPPLTERKQGGKVLSMRERMVRHRASPVCARCHQLMDPVGLSLEHFDAVGRWRAHDTVTRPASDRENGASIDASGMLPDGSTFEGVHGLRRALLQRPELFVTTVIEKLLTYALGRGLEPYDAAAVRQIRRDASNKEYRVSSIIQGIVKSVPFGMRRSQ